MASPLSGYFEQPSQPSRAATLGAVLGGFGAGMQGRGQENAMAIQAQQQSLNQDRQKAMAQDAMQVYNMLGTGKYDDAIGLIDRRVQAISQLGGDPSDTLEIRQLITSGRIPEATQELEGFLGQAMQYGLIEAPKAPEIVPASSIVDGQIVTMDAQGRPRAQQVPGFQQSAPQEPASVQALRIRADAAGLRPGTQEYADFMRSGGSGPLATTTVNLPSPVDKATEKFGEGIGERATGRLEQAASAQAQNDNLTRMSQAIAEGARTGLGQETLLNLQNFAQSIFGIPITEGAQEQEVIRALGNRLVMEVRNPASGMGLPGATSNRDLDFLTAAVPNLAKTPQGNALLIEYLMKQNQFKQDVANEQQRIIDLNNGAVPSNLDTQLMRFANNYQFADDAFKQEVEQAVQMAEQPASTDINSLLDRYAPNAR